MSNTETTRIADADTQRAMALRGQTQGALVLTGAGLGWTMVGLSALGDIPLWTLLAVLAAPALLLLGGLALRRATRSIPDPEQSPQMNRLFWQATGGEIISIVLIVLAGVLMHRPDWILPLVALAVGLHFFPLVRVFRRPLYAMTGAALCLIGLAALALVPPHLGVHRLPGRLLAVGLGGGVTLWTTALVMLLQSAAGLGKVRGRAVDG